ncbi:MAG: tetratricopeptide (TPR) repeat protein [Roseivirga sp.]|jgi:tetratricopeptide (TPR) repeat protein
MKNEVEELIKKGVDCCEKAEFEQGVKYLDKALAVDSQNALGLHNRARALSRIGKMKLALVDFKALTIQFPQNASFIADYAVALHLDNQNEQAVLLFEQALALEPTNPYRYASRAYFKDRTGDSEGAIQDYEKAIELDPEDAIALNNKGLIEEKLGYKERANKSFDKSNSLVGYNPSEKAKEKHSAPNFSQVQKPSSKEQNKRWAIIKSVFTKEGFKDFASFTKTLIEKKDKE